MEAKIAVLDRSQWAEEADVWQGEFEGSFFGANVSAMFYTTDKIGHGPKLHRHPYDEIFIIRQGCALFTIGDKQLEATAGQIVFGPANVAHKFINLGPGRLETTDLHASASFVQENLE